MTKVTYIAAFVSEHVANQIADLAYRAASQSRPNSSGIKFWHADDVDGKEWRDRLGYVRNEMMFRRGKFKMMIAEIYGRWVQLDYSEDRGDFLFTSEGDDHFHDEIIKIRSILDLIGKDIEVYEHEQGILGTSVRVA